MKEISKVLTAQDVGRELRCSVTRVHKVTSGKVKNVSRLPAIRMGRKSGGCAVLLRNGKEAMSRAKMMI